MLATPLRLPSCEIEEYRASQIFSSLVQSDSTHIAPIFDELKVLKERIGVFKLRRGAHEWKQRQDRFEQHNVGEQSKRGINRGYDKLMEILETSVIEQCTTCLHLCEAPGGFAQATLTKLNPTTSYAMSMRTNIGFHTLIKNSRCQILDLPNGCDILMPDISQAIGTLCPNTTFDFITADGAGNNDVDHSNVELNSVVLLAKQVSIAMAYQRKGGTLIVKIFGMAFPVTSRIVYVICASYDHVSVIKPHTSRASNDERYLICKGFSNDHSKELDVEGSLLKFASALRKPNDTWMSMYRDVASHFAHDQTHAILAMLNEQNNGKKRKIDRQQR